jgi:hypothetical protein
LTLHSVLCLVLLNYAGLQQKMSHKIVFTLPKQTFRSAPIKSSTMLFLTLRSHATPSVALLSFFSSVQFSRCISSEKTALCFASLASRIRSVSFPLPLRFKAFASNLF